MLHSEDLRWTSHLSCIPSTEGSLCGEEELTWDTHTVVLSYGGIVYKKWNFARRASHPMSISWEA
jgi:hypothetical protein